MYAVRGLCSGGEELEFEERVEGVMEGVMEDVLEVTGFGFGGGNITPKSVVLVMLCAWLCTWLYNDKLGMG